MWRSEGTCHVKIRKVTCLSNVKDNHLNRVSEVLYAKKIVAIILLWQTKFRARHIFKLSEGHLIVVFVVLLLFF